MYDKRATLRLIGQESHVGAADTFKTGMTVPFEFASTTLLSANESVWVMLSALKYATVFLSHKSYMEGSHFHLYSDKLILIHWCDSAISCLPHLLRYADVTLPLMGNQIYNNALLCHCIQLPPEILLNIDISMSRKYVPITRWCGVIPAILFIWQVFCFYQQQVFAVPFDFAPCAMFSANQSSVTPSSPDTWVNLSHVLERPEIYSLAEQRLHQRISPFLTRRPQWGLITNLMGHSMLRQQHTNMKWPKCEFDCFK